MILEIHDGNGNRIEILSKIPNDLKPYVLPYANPFAIKGDTFKALMLEFKGDGFAAWYSRYWMSDYTILKARGATPVLELRLSLKGSIKGTWDKVTDPLLPVHYFQMSFVPYIITKAIFEHAMEYHTFDIHFELSFLQEIGIDYDTLQRFIHKVVHEEPAAISDYPHRCSPLMIDEVNNILYNSFTKAGKERLVKNCVTNILIAALEEVGKQEMETLPLSKDDVEALYYVRSLIEQHVPIYLGNDVLVSKARPALNAFKLSYGFKRLFQISPKEYYLQIRFRLAKEMLREGQSVSAVAAKLYYESPSTFIKEFRKRFGYTPGFYQKHGD